MSEKTGNHSSIETNEIFEIDEQDKIVAEIPKKSQSKERNDELNFTIHIYKKCTIRIYKPLFALKLTFFLWYGGGAFVGQFLTLYFKQRGITLTELSTTYTLSPIVQILVSTFCGVLADKLGRLKPVLLMSMLINFLCLGSILLIPRLNVPHCHSEPINLKCHPRQFDRLITKTTCDIVEDTIEVKSCNVQCPENVTRHCDGKNLICEILAGNKVMRNFSLSIHVAGWTSTKNNRCFYNVSSMSHKNSTFSWCNVPHKMYCRVSCVVESGIKCATDNDRTLLLVASMVMYILLMSIFSNCYRLIDTISMSLITKHKADYGQHRLFATLGIIVFSPIAGLLVSSTSYVNSEKNYHLPLYFYLGLSVAVLLVVFKMDVTEYNPGKKMRKKTCQLLKNPDIAAFALVVFVLGTSYSFLKNFLFWYLEEMKSPSLLMGLIPAAEALYGLPFLATSGWWVKKVGPSNIFIIAFLAYVVNSTSYSFLNDPWYALILESSNVFTYHLLWVAVVVHSHSLAPEGMKATVIGTAGCIHYQIGKMSGGAIGGVVMSSFGGHIAFRLLAVICMVSAVAYALFLYIRRTCFTIKLNLDTTYLDAFQDQSRDDDRQSSER